LRPVRETGRGPCRLGDRPARPATSRQGEHPSRPDGQWARQRRACSCRPSPAPNRGSAEKKKSLLAQAPDQFKEGTGFDEKWPIPRVERTPSPLARAWRRGCFVEGRDPGARLLVPRACRLRAVPILHGPTIPSVVPSRVDDGEGGEGVLAAGYVRPPGGHRPSLVTTSRPRAGESGAAPILWREEFASVPRQSVNQTAAWRLPLFLRQICPCLDSRRSGRRQPRRRRHRGCPGQRPVYRAADAGHGGSGFGERTHTWTRRVAVFGG